LPHKAEIKDFEEVKDLMVKLPKAKDVKKLKEYVTENIEFFKKDNVYFHQEFKT